MKTLVLYASKHGAAFEIAKRIASKFDKAALFDLKQGGVPPIAEFDCVIIGSSIYAGTIRKEAKVFLTQNGDILRGKRLGLFLCGMDSSKEQEYLEANFDPDVLHAATAVGFLGGIFDPEKAGPIERFIMKTVAKQKEYLNTMDDNKISRFAKAMRT